VCTGPELQDSEVPVRLPRSRTVPDLVEEMAEAAAATTAFKYNGRSVTYGELDVRVRAGAAGLRALGVRRGANVGLLCPNRLEWIEVAVSAMAAGATVSAFNTWVKEWDLRYLLGRSEISVLVLAPRFGHADLLSVVRSLVPEAWASAPGEWRSVEFPFLESIIVLDDDGADQGRDGGPRGARTWAEVTTVTAEPVPESERPSAAETAVVLYTSGSTARPKGVPLLHHGLVENGWAIGERIGLEPSDRVWLSAPLFWSFGCANAVMATFTHGAALVLQSRFEAKEALELLASESCTTAYLMPNMTHALLAEGGRPDIGTLRKGVTIGRPDEVRTAAVDLGISEICNVYGATETYGNCCVTPHTLPLSARIDSQGPPLPGVKLRIVDPDTGQRCAAGTVGEIQVSGYIARKYVGDETEGMSLTDDGWYRSGDLGFLSDDEMVHFVGRSSEMIKSSGVNISPAEVEEFLKTHPAVDDVAVVGADHPVRGEVAVAFVTVRNDTSLTADELLAFCRDRISGYKVPASIEIVSELPLTETGKLFRRAVRENARRVVRELVDSGRI
jgi:fatty-acyl-CoA synthase